MPASFHHFATPQRPPRGDFKTSHQDRRDLAARHRRAMFAATLLGTLILVPLGTMLYLDRTKANVTLDEPRPIEDFVLKDVSGMPATKFDLEGSITVLFSLPPGCYKDCLALVDQAAQPIREFIEAKLTYDGLEVTPVQSWAIGMSLQEAHLDPFWRQFPIADESKYLIQEPHLKRTSYLAVIDQYAEVKAIISLSDRENLGYVKPLLSRMVMNHFMKDYLAKRTFFRREPKFEQQTDSPSL